MTDTWSTPGFLIIENIKKPFKSQGETSMVKYFCPNMEVLEQIKVSSFLKKNPCCDILDIAVFAMGTWPICKLIDSIVD